MFLRTPSEEKSITPVQPEIINEQYLNKRSKDNSDEQSEKSSSGGDSKQLERDSKGYF